MSLTAQTLHRTTRSNAAQADLSAAALPAHNGEVACGSTKRWGKVLLVEDDSSCTASRRTSVETAKPDVLVQVHSIVDNAVELVQSSSVSEAVLNGADRHQGRAGAALFLLGALNEKQEGSVVTANATYGCSRHFVKELDGSGFDFVVEVRPSTRLQVLADDEGLTSAEQIIKTLRSNAWKDHHVEHPLARTPFRFCAADAGEVALQDGTRGRLVIAQMGGVSLDVHRGTIFAFTNATDATVEDILQVVPWVRWIREHTRRTRREAGSQQPQLIGEADLEAAFVGASSIQVRPKRLVIRSNISIGRKHDQDAAKLGTSSLFQPTKHKGVLAPLGTLNAVELFAGAGGMGLGLLRAKSHDGRGYRIVYSGEIDPVYAQTLNINHRAVEERFGRKGLVPQEVEPVDLSLDASIEKVAAAAEAAGGAHVLVGGPPCQGFSAANRNSWSSDNPNNRLVDVYLRYVERLQPKVFLMENVQGILWTSKSGKRHDVSVAEDLQNRIEKAGYLVFSELLDAVWYGVPQHRNRFFLLGIRKDLGYVRSDFNGRGPFPHPTHGPEANRPYATVRQAIGDLPSIGNGHRQAAMSRVPVDLAVENEFLKAVQDDSAPDAVWDHITSAHAPYVIDRYKAIPEGGNWQDIQEMMTNYASIERTHSNIYRRLKWDEPSVTMGHYRKSMLIHPSQHRGLSLREAMRLQSFPDWFRFAGSASGVNGGLMHKQQQLANAVCPLVLQAIAQEILKL